MYMYFFFRISERIDYVKLKKYFRDAIAKKSRERSATQETTCTGGVKMWTENQISLIIVFSGRQTLGKKHSCCDTCMMMCLKNEMHRNMVLCFKYGN